MELNLTSIPNICDTAYSSQSRSRTYKHAIHEILSCQQNFFPLCSRLRLGSLQKQRIKLVTLTFTIFWVVVEPTHLKNSSQIGNLP